MNVHFLNWKINKSYFTPKFAFLLLFVTACGGIVPGPILTVVETKPENGATNIDLNKIITVSFNKKMAPETLTDKTVILREKSGEGFVKIAGDLSFSEETKTATFKLKDGETLNGSKLFQVTVTTGVTDLFGKPLPADHTWEFMSAVEGTFDGLAPTVVSKTPDINEENVGIKRSIKVTFNEAIDPATITSLTFSVNHGVKGSFDISGNVVILTPSQDLDEGREYTVVIQGKKLIPDCNPTPTIHLCVTDLAGNPLKENVSWIFKTEKPDNKI